MTFQSISKDPVSKTTVCKRNRMEGDSLKKKRSKHDDVSTNEDNTSEELVITLINYLNWIKLVS